MKMAEGRPGAVIGCYCDDNVDSFPAGSPSHSNAWRCEFDPNGFISDS